MKSYPVQMGLKENGDIMLVQVDVETGQKRVITISPEQVEQVVSALRIAVETFRKTRDNLNDDQSA